MSDSNWKRQDYLEWSDYFMAVAFLSAQRSKDPSSQVGACIVSPERKIVGIGYNGMPNGCSDDLLPWRREAEDPLDTKYPYGERTQAGENHRRRGPAVVIVSSPVDRLYGSLRWL